MPVAGAAQNLPEFDRILTHELTHAMLHSVAAQRPRLAERGPGDVFRGQQCGSLGEAARRARAYVPLAHLDRSFTGLSAQQADLAYEMSAFATSALLTRIGVTNLRFLLQDLDRGSTFDAAVQRFGQTMTEFERQLAKRVGGTRR